MKVDSVKSIKKRIAEMPLYGNQCFVCEVKFGRKMPVIHHLWYEDNQKKYSDYSSQLEYHIDLERDVQNNPKQFMLLCNKHHVALHRLKRFGSANRYRLLQAERMTA